MVAERLAAYLARIGLDTPPPATAAGLSLVQAAHRQAIPFENLDVLLGRGIAIDPDAVFAKLVSARRGGYCFEHNRLLADMLAAMGIATRPLLARTRLGIAAGTVMPRTHVVLLCEIEGERWIADAGFGGSFVPPQPLVDGAEVSAPDGARHRLLNTGERFGDWLLERAGPRATTDGRASEDPGWQPQYAFDLAPVAQADLEQANFWSCASPTSRFVSHPIVSLVLPTGFMALNGRRLGIADGGQVEQQTIADRHALRAVLAERFGIVLSEDEVAVLPLPQ